LSAAAPTVLIDLIAAQSPSYRDRGIARYGLGSTAAMIARRPDLVAGVRVHPELPPASGLAAIEASGKVVTGLGASVPGDILHITSVFEPEVPIRRLWPAAAMARRMPLVVTVYDLIPEVLPEQYLMDPGLRRRWRAAREIVRAADHVLAISESVREDILRLLGVPARRVTAVGSGCDDRFVRPADRGESARSARAAVEGLEDRYVVYNGAVDPRKNVERLIQAFALLPPPVRERWQLVLVCATRPLERNHYLVTAERLGIAGRVVVPGFVPDRVLIELYQGADLSVFPSLYEGYGLPIVEALACGAPVIGADNSSIRELLPPDMRFDGYDTAAMADALRRGLTDEGFRRRLLERTDGPRPTWDEVAERTEPVYELLGAGLRLTRAIRPGWRPRHRVAVVNPSEAAGAAAGAYAGALVTALCAAADVDVYEPGAAPGPAGEAVTLIGDPWRIRRVAPWRGGYDAVVVHAGDHESFATAVALLPLLPDAIVIAHDGSLARAYAHAARMGRLRPDPVTESADGIPATPAHRCLAVSEAVALAARGGPDGHGGGHGAVAASPQEAAEAVLAAAGGGEQAGSGLGRGRTVG
jgi:glycosyltransferase involved in cell wall biosynthesis